MKCWHCCIDLPKNKENIFRIPLSIDINNKIMCIGHTCCVNCSLAYIITSNNIYDISLSIQLLYDMYNIKSNIFPSPCKELLIDFGGTMSYKKFHENHEKHYTSILLPPFLPLESFNTENIKIMDYNLQSPNIKNDQMIHFTNQEIQNKNKKLSLRRKKPMSSKHVSFEKTMGLYSVIETKE